MGPRAKVLIGKGKLSLPPPSSSDHVPPASQGLSEEMGRQQAAQKEDCQDKGSGAGSQETDGKVVIYSNCYQCLNSLVHREGVCNDGGGGNPSEHRFQQQSVIS